MVETMTFPLNSSQDSEATSSQSALSVTNSESTYFLWKIRYTLIDLTEQNNTRKAATKNQLQSRISG